MDQGQLLQRFYKAGLCLAIGGFVILGCTTHPTTTSENLTHICEPTNPAGRLIVSNRQISLTVADIEVAIDQVQNILAEFDGYVDQEQPQAYGSTEANFVVRLPKERFNEATQHIKMVGEKVNNERAIGQDITEQYAHLKAQLCDLEEEAIALRQRIARNQADHLFAQLTDLESEIEFMRGKIVYRDERLALATLTLILVVE
jgi:hypothetical protein